MDHFYRRRDVRDLCERVFDVLGVQLDDRAEFARDFLTGVRDFMRAGVKFEDAVLTFEDPSNVSLSEQPEEEAEGATRAPEELTPAANMARAIAARQS